MFPVRKRNVSGEMSHVFVNEKSRLWVKETSPFL